MLRPGHAVALCALALLVLGVIMVSSAGMTLRQEQAVTLESIVTSKTAMLMALAMVAMCMTAMLPIRRLVPGSLRGTESSERSLPDAKPDQIPRMFDRGWLRRWIVEMVRLWPLWIGTGALLAVVASVYVPGIASPRKGAHRWVNLRLPGFDSVQPSEFAKWGILLLIAWYGAKYARRMSSFWFGLVPGLIASGAIAAMVVKEDLGTGALIAAAAVVMLLASGCRWWQLVILTPIPVLGAAAAIAQNPYRVDRIKAFLDPYADPEGIGYHMIQSMVAVANGGGVGRGLGNGLQKFEYLPEDTTDFLFAIVCEELGIAGAAMVLALYVGLVWAIWLVLRREQWAVLKLTALGVMTTLGLQAVINLAVVTGLGPTKGIALPLMSSGGTGWVLISAALGLVIAIDRSQARASGMQNEHPSPANHLDDDPGIDRGSSPGSPAAASQAIKGTRVESADQPHPSLPAPSTAALESPVTSAKFETESRDVQSAVELEPKPVRPKRKSKSTAGASQDAELPPAVAATPLLFGEINPPAPSVPA